MNRIFLLFTAAFLFTPSLRAGDDKVNVLGYYAVNNSLDGQLMVDMVNVLRFYPVFAMRDSTNSVFVTIYYGGNIFSRPARQMDGGRYWQVLLPIFRLGEAIQRIEVDVRFGLRKSIIESYQKKLDIIAFEIRNEQDKERQKFKGTKKEFGDLIKSNNKEFNKLGLTSAQADQLRKHLEEDVDTYETLRDSLITGEADREIADSLISIRSQSLKQYLSNYEIDVKQKIMSLELQRNQVLDSVRTKLARLIEIDLTDTNYSGPSVRRSDLIISDDLNSARILYRNYKKELRYMPALDPAERMGVFRVRYVPFPVVGTPDNAKTTLRGPTGDNALTVFEVGLAFGDAIVPGDEFVMPEFSFRRLGFAFAITEKLFNSDAQIVALALTYDFNSYGSIGVGANLAQHQVHEYFSFGINKKAFEVALAGLTGLFK
ncbi:MAG: hypothetical protein HYR76_05545 [Ignavibacteria bacterium]|nr:hypothetical protein [Ignavibacteria bacterium]MBI3764975.1 hypothetical protein [Ignavibacteriales bacterium]